MDNKTGFGGRQIQFDKRISYKSTKILLFSLHIEIRAR